MFAKFYTRKRDTGLDNYPAIQQTMGYLNEAANRNLAVKTLYLTEEECSELAQELLKLKSNLAHVKNFNDPNSIAMVLGVEVEPVNELKSFLIDKTA